MRPNIVRTVCFTALLVSLAAVASAQGRHHCSERLLEGDWGYTKTGTLFLPTGPVPFATVGKLTLDRHGNLSGVNNGSVGGTISQDVLSGTFTVNPDCTGAATVEVYDQSGVLLRTLEMALIIDDDLGQFRGLVTQLTLPNAVSLKTTITAEGKRVFSGRDD
ncbi:MAG: hypothetical protein B7Z68_04690 [Acidobacteria bacterium 21-70-11]|nr:MAG: hypothetical protein B7Z68_04690 [Acidobacteria bacterium 21-70-11]HQU34164.1 hypothetical protein [Thermoanaerobaculaceae bacterium]